MYSLEKSNTHYKENTKELLEFMTNIGNAPMTSSIFSPQPSHVKPITPDKMIMVISDNSCSSLRVPYGFLGPRFRLSLDPLSFIVIFSHTHM